MYGSFVRLRSPPSPLCLLRAITLTSRDACRARQPARDSPSPFSIPTRRAHARWMLRGHPLLLLLRLWRQPLLACPGIGWLGVLRGRRVAGVAFPLAASPPRLPLSPRWRGRREIGFPTLPIRESPVKVLPEARLRRLCRPRLASCCRLHRHASSVSIDSHVFSERHHAAYRWFGVDVSSGGPPQSLRHSTGAIPKEARRLLPRNAYVKKLLHHQGTLTTFWTRLEKGISFLPQPPKDAPC